MNALLEQAGVWLPGTVAMLALTAASAFFSGCETAMFSLTREDLRRMGTGRPRERLAAALMRTPDRFLSAVLFWNLLVNLSFFTVSLITASRERHSGNSRDLRTAASSLPAASAIRSTTRQTRLRPSMPNSGTSS